MNDRARAWSVAFHRQASTDLATYDALCRTPLPACQRLHFLQMWLEKLSKSYLWSAADPVGGFNSFERSHNVIAKVLPAVLREHWRRVELPAAPDEGLFQRHRELCREIDLLAPAVDDGGHRRDSCEYPWQDIDETAGPVIRVPAEWTFPLDQKLRTPTGKRLLKAAKVLTAAPVW